MKNQLNAFQNFFVHPSLKQDIEEYGKAKILFYAMLVTSVFSSSYSTYYELTHDQIPLIKHIANYLGMITGPLGLMVLKITRKFSTTLTFLLILSISLIFTSTYYSGGIYSVDLLWLTLVTLIAFLYTSLRGGIVILTLSCSFFLVFYILDNMQVFPFEEENNKLGKGYILFNLYFQMGVTAMCVYLYVKGNNRIRAELAELKEKQVQNLDNKYKHITDNANEIIALHKSNYEVTYLSPAVNSILGYNPNEINGTLYVDLLGGIKGNGEYLCKAKNGREVYLELTLTPIPDELGTGEVFISMARDITDKVLENNKIALLRKQIANDFHDEMGNKLAAITLNSSILSMQIKEDVKIQDTIKKIEETSKSLYQHSRDFIWSIDSKSDDLREIFSYIRDFGEDFFHSLPVNFLVSSKDFSAQQTVALPMYTGRHIILILKEIITNAAKHSQCKNITLSLEVSDHFYSITLKDDGKGIDETSKKGKGLISIKERAKTINCELIIHTNSQGTEIVLKGKLPHSGSAQQR